MSGESAFVSSRIFRPRTNKSRLMVSPAPWVPTDFAGLAAWYDVSDFSSLRVDSASRVSLVEDKSGNSAVNCLVSSSAINNSATVPNNSIYTSDIYDIKIDCRAANWTPSAEQGLVGQYGYSEAQRSWALGWGVFGSYNRLSFRVAPTGAAATVLAVATENLPYSSFSRGWVRATYIRNTGSGNFAVSFYTSSDGVNWAQLGTTVTGPSIAATFNSSSPVMIGAVGSIATNVGGFSGNIYRVIVATSIDGTPVLDANFSLAAKLATSFTESSANAATVTINTSGATGARISGERDLYQGTVANQPIYLSFDGDKYAFLNGASGTYLSSPDSTANSITGTIDLEAEVSLPNYATGTVQALVSKYITTTGQRSYSLGISATGFPIFAVSSDGGIVNVETITASASLASVGIIANTRVFIRATWVAGTRLTTFLYSSDGQNWTRLGTTVNGTIVNSIFDSTSPVEIGSITSGTINLLSGKVFSAKIYNGIRTSSSSPVFDFNANNYSTGSTLNDASANVATITINGGATIVTAPALYFDGVNDYLKAPAFSLNQPQTTHLVFNQSTWTSNDTLYDGHANGLRAALYQRSTSPNLTIFAGANGPDNSLSLKTRALVSAIFNIASSFARVNKGIGASGNCGPQNPNGFTLGAGFDGTVAANIVANEVAIYSEAQTTTQLDQFADYASKKWGWGEETSFNPGDLSGLQYWMSAQDISAGYQASLASLPDRANGWVATQGTGTNQARFLPHDGGAENNYLRLPGISGNYASTPDSAVLDITGDISFEVFVSSTNWSSGSEQTLVAKYDGTTNQRSYWFRINATGGLGINWSTDGLSGTLVSVNSTASLGLSANSRKWVKATLDVNNGAGGNTVSFFTSDDGANWTPLGVPVVTAGVTSIFSGNFPVTIGGQGTSGGFSLLSGRIYTARLYNGINGTLVANFDASRGNGNSSTIVASTGETWTINRTGADPAMIVSSPQVLFVTDDYYDLPSASYGVAQNVTGITMFSTARSSSLATPATLFAISIGSAAAPARASISVTAIPNYRVGGRRLDADSFAERISGTPTTSVSFIQCGVLDYSSATAQIFVNGVSVGGAGAFQTPGSTSNTASLRARIGSSLGDTPSEYMNGTVSEVIIYNRALTATEILQVSRFLAARTGGAITI